MAGPTYNDYAQGMLQAYQAGDLAKFNQLASALQQLQTGDQGAQSSLSPEDRAAQQAALTSPSMTATRSLLHDVTFGLSDRAAEGLDALAGDLGLPHAGAQQMQDQANTGAQMHPWANDAGHVAGILEGAKILTPALEAAGLVPAAGAGAVANGAKLAGAGAVTSAAQATANGESPGDVGTSAVIGGIAGPVGAKVADLAGGAITRAAEATGLKSAVGRGWKLLAKKLGVTANDLTQWSQNFEQTNGFKPNIASMLGAHARGEVKGLASANPELRGTMTDVANVMTEKAGTAPAEIARRSEMTAAMDPIRDTPVALPKDLRDDADLRAALKGRAFRNLRIRLHKDELTLGDVDQIRQQLNTVSPNPGSEFAQLADEVRSHAEDQVPAYGDMLQKYAEQSNVIAGMKHGLAGGTAETAPVDLQKRMGKPGTDRGLQAGQQLRANLRGTREASGGVAPPSEDRAAENVVRGVAETVAGSHGFGPANVVRGLSRLLKGEHLPPDVQRQLAYALTTNDPTKFKAAIGALRQAGVDNAKTSALEAAFAAQGGAFANRTMDTQQ